MPEYGMERREPSGWAIGFTGFAGFMLIMIGVFHVIAGLTGIFRGEFYAATPNYVFNFNIAGWGWAHLILGVIVVAAGFGVFTGAVWARVIGVLFALLSAIANFLFLPYYPLWSLAIIAIDIAVIWALTAHGRDITMAE